MFTALPVGALQPEPETTRTALRLAPIAVLPVAVIAAGAGLLVGLLSAPAMIIGLIVVGLIAVGTRAFHLDGLADTVDGFGSGWDRDRALSIMRRGDIGPMGVTSLIIVIGLQGFAYGTLAADSVGAIAVVVLICLSRTALLIGCCRPVPSARSEGLGAMVAGSVPVAVTVVVGLSTTALMGLVGAWLPGASWLSGALATIAAWSAVVLTVHHAVRRFGGITGDVLGATVEIAATVMAVGLILH